MPPIGLGATLGIGGGRAATSSGALFGGALTDNLAYPNGLYTNSNYVLSVQPLMHFDAYDMNGNNDGSAGWSDDDEITTGAGNIWVERSQRDGTYDASQSVVANQPTFKISGDDKYVNFDGGDVLALATSAAKGSTEAFTIVNISKTDSPQASVFTFAPSITSYGSVQTGKWTDNNVYIKAAPSIASSQDYTSLDMRLIDRNGSNLVTLYTSGNNSQGTLTKSSIFTFDSIGKAGTASWHLGDMSEILLFESVLSVADKNVLRTFFANKYSSLPTLAAWT